MKLTTTFTMARRSSIDAMSTRESIQPTLALYMGTSSVTMASVVLKKRSGAAEEPFQGYSGVSKRPDVVTWVPHAPTCQYVFNKVVRRSDIILSGICPRSLLYSVGFVR